MKRIKSSILIIISIIPFIASAATNIREPIIHSFENPASLEKEKKILNQNKPFGELKTDNQEGYFYGSFGTTLLFLQNFNVGYRTTFDYPWGLDCQLTFFASIGNFKTINIIPGLTLRGLVHFSHQFYCGLGGAVLFGPGFAGPSIAIGKAFSSDQKIKRFIQMDCNLYFYEKPTKILPVVSLVYGFRF